MFEAKPFLHHLDLYLSFFRAHIVYYTRLFRLLIRVIEPGTASEKKRVLYWCARTTKASDASDHEQNTGAFLWPISPRHGLDGLLDPEATDLNHHHHHYTTTAVTTTAVLYLTTLLSLLVVRPDSRMA